MRSYHSSSHNCYIAEYFKVQEEVFFLLNFRRRKRYSRTKKQFFLHLTLKSCASSIGISVSICSNSDFFIPSIWDGYTLLCPAIRKLMTFAIAASGAICEPNNSIAIIVDAIGVFVVPDTSAVIPIAAPTIGEIRKGLDIRLPKVDPTKNTGVKIPPFPPKDRVIVVKIVFKKGDNIGTLPPFKAVFISFIPKERYIVPNIKVRITITKPPSIDLSFLLWLI